MTKVYDKQGREITADRIIAAARSAGLRLERGWWILPREGSCCAGGALAISVEPAIRSGAQAVELLKDCVVSESQRWGLSDGFSGGTREDRNWCNQEEYQACYAIGAEVYRRRHQADERRTGESE